MELQVNTTLQNGKYTIIKKLGSGGFGITYLATQKVFVTGGLGTIDAEVKVTIKEFFMKDFCNREVASAMVTVPSKSVSDLVEKYRQKFVKEADKISKLKHPNIVKVLDFFDENGTSYYVMEYIEGGSLADKVRKNGLSEQLATRYILQVADALNYIHQKRITHLDIKPSNIMLSKDDNAILIDFGLSKQYDELSGGETSTTQPGFSDGYAPIEQYIPGGVSEFSPETDIYSLGATFFKLLTGLTPPKASEIADNGVPVGDLKGVNKTIVGVICKTMESSRRNRMRDVVTFIDELKRHRICQEPQINTAIKTEVSMPVIEMSEQEMEILQSLKKNNQYKEAYYFCLDMVRQGKSVEYSRKECEKLIVSLQKKSKKDNRKLTLIGLVLTILFAIMYFFIGLIQN